MKVPYVNFGAQFEETRDETIKAIADVMNRGDFILGREVGLFEKEFASLCGVKHAVAVANGTDSLILALRALDIGSGDEVITAANSWISSASAIALVGARPVFADVGVDQNISPEALESAITPRTKAIMPVHLTGRCADMKRILKIGMAHGIPIVEDAAQSVLAETNGIRAGAGGLVGSFSLHPLKNLNAAGDAGILTTHDDSVAEKLRLLRNHGLKNRDEVVHWGYNSRLDTLQAAILLVRLPLLKRHLKRRREIARRYIEGLSAMVQCPVEQANEFHTYHLFVIQCEKRNALHECLARNGIEAKIHYPIPIHLQEAAGYLGYKRGSLPVTEAQAERILSLPVNQFLTDEQVDTVIEAVRSFYGR